MKKRLFTVSVAALLLATGTAHTETDVLGCFVRTYDKAHLARHPDQLVTAVKLHIYHPPAGVGTPPLKEAEAKNATWMKMEVKVRGRDVILTIGAICHKGAAPATGWTFACSGAHGLPRSLEQGQHQSVGGYKPCRAGNTL
jgi:hypothetical protein